MNARTARRRRRPDSHLAGVCARAPRAVLGTLLMSVGVCGCFSNSSSPIEQAPVSGELLLDGRPLGGAVIHLLPVAGAGAASSATTDAQGKFAVATLDRQPGAAPGEYKVVVTGLPHGEYSPQASSTLPSARVPAIYSLPDTTPLQLHVPPPTPLRIELQSSPPPPSPGRRPD